MVYFAREVTTLAHQIQKKDLNIGNTRCMKYRPEDVPALHVPYDGLKRIYVIHQSSLD
jgi:hypothetical protein